MESVLVWREMTLVNLIMNMMKFVVQMENFILLQVLLNASKWFVDTVPFRKT